MSSWMSGMIEGVLDDENELDLLWIGFAVSSIRFAVLFGSFTPCSPSHL